MTDQDVDAPAAPPAGEAALARYRRTTRRRNAVYFGVLTVLVAAIGVVVAVAWTHGEIAHTSLNTFAPPPPTLAAKTPAATPQQAWHTGDRVAIGSPQWGGTVVTYSKHTVGGRDARTGKRTWTYTRTDRSVCIAAQTGGTTMAVYKLHGNCDEVTALDSDTGARRWTRTLDMDGMPVNGVPTFQASTTTLLVVSPAVIYAIDPGSGYNRWTYARYGCRIQRAALGSNGVLISQDCSSQVRCKGVKFCGTGPQLLLRDPTAGRGDNGKPNADQIKWNLLGNQDVPVCADQLVTAVDPAGQRLSVLDLRTGRRTGTVTLHPRTAKVGAVTAVSTSSDELVWMAGTLYAIRPDGTADWSAAAPAPPTVLPADASTVALSAARVTLVRSDGVVSLNGADGHAAKRFSIPAPSGALAYPLGTGFLVAGPFGGATAYL